MVGLDQVIVQKRLVVMQVDLVAVMYVRHNGNCVFVLLTRNENGFTAGASPLKREAESQHPESLKEVESVVDQAVPERLRLRLEWHFALRGSPPTVKRLFHLSMFIV